MKDQNIKTIRFPITADSRLQKMADKCGLTRIDFFIAMVDYFYKSKKDPRDINDELLKKELVKRSDTTIGFIRTMEEELLRPLKKTPKRSMRSKRKSLTILTSISLTITVSKKLNMIGRSTAWIEPRSLLKGSTGRKCRNSSLKINSRRYWNTISKQGSQWV